jgi:hypothetical protein
MTHHPLNATADLANVVVRFAERTVVRGIPFREALTDALETWLTQDDAEQEWRRTEEGRAQCGGAVILDELRGATAEQLRAAIDAVHRSKPDSEDSP